MWYFAGVPVIPENRPWFVAIFFFTCLAFAVVLMRVYTRLFITRIFGIDDYLMVASMALSIAYIGTVVHEMELGLGYRVRQEDYLSFVKSEFFTTLIYTWNQWVIKMSILALYWRVFVTQKPRKILKWLIGWLCIYGLVNCIAPIFSCIPVQKFWNPSLDGHCMQGGELHYVLATCNAINDFAILIFPIPILLKLKMPLRVRVILIMTLTCGLLASVVSIVRFYALVHFFEGPRENAPVLAVPISTWSSLEVNLAIICSSVATLKPLFAQFVPRLDFSSGSSDGSAKKSSNQRSDQSSWISLTNRRTTFREPTADLEGGKDRGGLRVEQTEGIMTQNPPRNSSQQNLVAGDANPKDVS
ncbi:unnamed protein product [Clonostachys rosea f. rosea IK726]|uniref:Rhodopsin domain-containing protein n=2 Tax=Bionectria ochroleuca TaxID=29856 RepID=A0A0B7KKZ6_BIOOC|nr:unnamed protein product [Clonostachys rosea f. rosea IK726]